MEREEEGDVLRGEGVEEPGREMAEVLDGIPGIESRLETARQQIADGEGIPLEDL